jgi:hypothetical protein
MNYSTADAYLVIIHAFATVSYGSFPASITACKFTCDVVCDAYAQLHCCTGKLDIKHFKGLPGIHQNSFSTFELLDIQTSF